MQTGSAALVSEQLLSLLLLKSIEKALQIKGFAKRNWMKIAVKAKWLHEWIDDETGPEGDYIDSEKKFTISLSGIGKTVFLTESEAESKLKEMGEKDGE